jgi:hypothetical protein
MIALPYRHIGMYYASVQVITSMFVSPAFGARMAVAAGY